MQIEKVKQVLGNLFQSLSQKYHVIKTDIELMFILTSPHNCKCKYGDLDVELTEGYNYSFIEKPLAKMAINKFISSALVRFSHENSIPMQSVNVIMKNTGDQEFDLRLRNGFTDVGPITVDQLIN